MDLDSKYIKITNFLQKKVHRTSFPNPTVFSLIVESDKKFSLNRIVSFGFTQKGGRPHAEALAISEVKFLKNRIYTLYSTLEPCCHEGRDESCVEKIIKSNIQRVVFSLKDPDKRVNGKGKNKLERNGLKVKYHEFDDESQNPYKGYILNRKSNRPKVTLKVGCSMDSKIAVKRGQRDQITNKIVKKIVHNIRSENDAILVGGNTIKIDNPDLNCRIPGLENLSPYKVILSKSLNFDSNSKIFKRKNRKLTIIFTLESNLKKIRSFKSKCYKLVTLNKEDFNLSNILSKLAQFGICNLLVEGGSKIFTSFLNEGLVDQLIIFRSNFFIGPQGQEMFSDKLKLRQNFFLISNVLNIKNNIMEIFDRKS